MTKLKSNSKGITKPQGDPYAMVIPKGSKIYATPDWLPFPTWGEYVEDDTLNYRFIKMKPRHPVTTSIYTIDKKNIVYIAEMYPDELIREHRNKIKKSIKVAESKD